MGKRFHFLKKEVLVITLYFIEYKMPQMEISISVSEILKWKTVYLRISKEITGSEEDIPPASFSRFFPILGGTPAPADSSPF